MSSYGDFRVFGELSIDSYTADRLEALKQTIQSEAPDYLLNVNEAEYVEHLVSRFALEPLVLHFDSLEASPREAMIRAELFPPTFNVRTGKSYPKQVIQYHLPATGNLELLRCTPNPHLLWTHTVSLENGAVCFEFIDFSGTAATVKNEADSLLGSIKTQAGHLAGNVERFNNSLRGEAEGLFRKRKHELLARTQALAGLGVPIRKATNVPQTFAVPAQRRQIVARPTATGSPAKAPDPTLDEGVYQEILQTIHETGKVFERLPATYAAKDEEALRDHLILQLEPRFVYSTTGETFNSQGKTDILVRHEKNNIFVAECKFWRGAKTNLSTIDQILSYLTWRDSKTAIIYFVDSKEMGAPLKALAESTPQHPSFVKANDRKHDSWFDYTFCLPTDRSIQIRLTILCFHLPRIG